MLRVLLIAVAVVVLIAMLRGTLRRLRGDAERPAAPPPPAPPTEAARLEEMVACAHCGVHLPRGDAVAGTDGTLFCGEPHRLAHAQGRPPQR